MLYRPIPPDFKPWVKQSVLHVILTIAVNVLAVLVLHVQKLTRELERKTYLFLLRVPTGSRR